MNKHLGMYIHMHWSYRHPYAARTWKSGDWAGYLSGLVDLGYNTVMIWPMLETIPDQPTDSDIVHLELIQDVIHSIKHRFGMEALVTLGPNTIANENASEYAFDSRPFFKTTQRLDPSDTVAMDRLFSVREKQMEYLSEADGIVVIDSDPGGYVGSTNEEFVCLLERYMDLASKFNSAMKLYYWMWVGWETYNRMWKSVQDGEASPGLDIGPEDFDDVLAGLKKSSRSNWALLSCFKVHQDMINKHMLQDRSLFYPYGLIEGEPTFPLTNWNPENIANEFRRYIPEEMRLGAMGNSQTHAVQLPHTYAFAKAAGSECMGCDSLEEFADALIPGEGALISQVWQALQGDDSSLMYTLVPRLREKSFEEMSSGSAGGLLLMSPGEFMEDLAFQLEFRADIVDLKTAIRENGNIKYAAGSLVRSWKRWQIRTGFADSYYNLSDLNETLLALNDPGVNSVFADFNDWRNPETRHNVVPRLLDAIDKWASE